MYISNYYFRPTVLYKMPNYVYYFFHNYLLNKRQYYLYTYIYVGIYAHRCKMYNFL